MCVYICLLYSKQYQIVVRVSGYMMTDKLEIPRRRVRKNWYGSLNPDPVDRSHPDVHDEQLVAEAAETKSTSRKYISSLRFLVCLTFPETYPSFMWIWILWLKTML